MKLARIILPIMDNQLRPLNRQHEELKDRLLADWGGYTVTDGRGAWLHEGKVYAEQVMIYAVAMERADVVRFRTLAAEIARAARQECVMIVTPNDDVEFVKPEAPQRGAFIENNSQPTLDASRG
jgi:hypothetical protein